MIYTLDQSSPTPETKGKDHVCGANDQPTKVSPTAENGLNPRIIYEHSFDGKTLRKSRSSWSALIDRGANGCIAGRDMRVIEKTGATIDLCGIDDHMLRDLPIVTAGGVVRTQKGEVIVVFHQVADMTRESKTILSCGQMEHFGCTVNEKPMRVSNSTPYIQTVEGYQIPITIRRGLAYIQMRPYRDKEWKELPHVVLTSPRPWDPSALDSTVEESWYNRQDDVEVLTNPLASFDTVPMEEDEDELVEEDDRKVRSINRHDVRTYYTDTIQDEIGDGFIVCEMEGALYDIDFDEELHGEYYDSDDMLECHPMTTRRSTRKSTQDSTKRSRAKRKERGKRKTEFPKTPQVEVPNMEELPELMNRQGSSSDSSDDEVRTDSNNQARTYEAPTTTSRPSKQNLERFTRHFPGANLDTIKRTFKATTQLGTRGAVEGINLRHRLVAPNPILNIP